MYINKNTNFGTHNTSKRSGAIKYLAIHYVGATGDAKANVNYYNQKTTTNASADFFVGHNGDIWQYNPDPKARYCWAVGGKKQSSAGGTLYGVATNANCISIEMCVKTKGSKNANSPDWYFTDATIDATVELAKYLMDLYDIPLSNVIRHFDVNGKACPGVVGWNSRSGSEAKWNEFKARLVEKKPEPKPETVKETYRVRKSWDDKKSQLGAYTILANAKKVADKNPGYEVYNSAGVCVYAPKVDNSFKVKVSIKDLNIRTGAGTNYKRVSFIKPGVYTIVEVKAGKGSVKGWGKLLSGAGWISLDYAKRL